MKTLLHLAAITAVAVCGMCGCQAPPPDPAPQDPSPFGAPCDDCPRPQDGFDGAAQPCGPDGCPPRRQPTAADGGGVEFGQIQQGGPGVEDYEQLVVDQDAATEEKGFIFRRRRQRRAPQVYVTPQRTKPQKKPEPDPATEVKTGQYRCQACNRMTVGAEWQEIWLPSGKSMLAICRDCYIRMSPEERRDVFAKWFRKQGIDPTDPDRKQQIMMASRDD